MTFFYDDLETRTGRAGHVHDSSPFKDIIRRKVGTGAAEVRSITVDTSRNSHVYAFTLAGVAFSITSAAAATLITIAKQIQDAINGSSLFGVLYAQSDGVDTVNVTYRTAGTAFTLTDADDDLTTALVTSASSGSSLPPGVIAMEDANDPGQNGAITLPTSITPVAKVVDVTPVFSAGDELALNITVLGITYPVVVTMTTDLETTINALVDAIEDAMPASTVAATDGATKLTLTSEVAGQDFKVAAGSSDVSDGDSDAATITTVTENTAAAFTGSLLGPVLLEQVGELPNSGSFAYSPGEVVGVGRVGRFDVPLDAGETVAAGDSVYVRTTASASEQLGACRNDADGGDCILWARARFISSNFTGLDSQNCATIEVYDSAA